MADDQITIIGVEKLRKRFQILGRGIVDPVVLDRMGNYLTVAIQYRTLAGKDIEGNPFAPYTARYRMFRKKTGRPTKPNLKYHGSMLNALTYKTDVDREEVKVFFMEGEDRSGVSNPAKAFYLQDKRPFFGASVEDIERINEIYRMHVRGLLRGY